MRRPSLCLLAVSATVLAACASPAQAPPSGGLDPADWGGVQQAARGQTLDWYMYTGDDAINGFVNGYLTQKLSEAGVTLKVVSVADTADAVNKVLAEKQAGRTTDGTVDLIWINGENFATGKQAGLWYCGYPQKLPSAQFIDGADPAIANDFGVPVDGCEAAWQRANSALVYDSATLGAADVASLTALEAWARANPGRFTYPAPPDFTGSMAVRTFLYDVTGGPATLAGAYDQAAFAAVGTQLWARLNALEPALWRGGQTYPTSQDAVEQLYATGEISAFFTYGPGQVKQKVEKGTYPATTREAVPSVGNISNISFVAIPANSPDKAAALVLANLLQDPQTQLQFFAEVGTYPAVELSRTAPAIQQQFAAVPGNPSVLTIGALTAHAQPELDSGYVTAVEDGWKANVLQK